MLALVFGILANAGAQRERDSAFAPKLHLGWRLSLPVIGLILVVQSVRLLPGEYFTERSRTALRDDQPASAIFFALRALSWEQKNPNLYQYLGNARAGLGDTMTDPRARLSFYEAAINAFEKGRMLAPLDRNFAIQLASVYDELGRFAEAEWMFNEALRLDPKSESLRRYYEAHLERWELWLTGEKEVLPSSG
jgi:tetratricopeptide (TPR) repeat protein